MSQLFKLEKMGTVHTPYRPVEYFVGFPWTCQFTPETRGVLDPGFVGRLLYATNISMDDRDAVFCMAGYAGLRKVGWNGCLALPRVLTIASDGTPRQVPVQELKRGGERYIQVFPKNEHRLI